MRMLDADAVEREAHRLWRDLGTSRGASFFSSSPEYARAVIARLRVLVVGGTDRPYETPT